tara:strand:+ start:58 stop:564 length:507 start_codon:yes stop_codon:yes gene_type:complete
MPPKEKGLPQSMPWYTKGLLKLMGDSESLYHYDSDGNIASMGRYTYNPESIDIMYNMFIDELGFSPKMVNRKNILTKVLPNEISSYLKTGDVSKDLINIRHALTDVHINQDSKKQKELISALLEYNKKTDIYNNQGEEFIEKAVNSGLLNAENMRKMYFEKYRDEYGK